MNGPRASLADRGVPLRVAIWAGFGALLAVRILSVTGALAGERWLSEATYLLPILLSAGGAAWAAARSTGAERVFWRFLSVAVALLLVQETYYSYYVLAIDPAGPSSPGPQQLFGLAASCTFFAMVVSISRFRGATSVARARFYAGAAAGTVVLFVGFFEWWIVPAYLGTPGVTLPNLVVSAVYPVLGTMMLLATFGVIFGLRSGRWHGWDRVAIAALAVYSAGLVLMPFWFFASHASTAGAMQELGLSLGPYLLFTAVAYRFASRGDAHPLQQRPTLDETPRFVVVLFPVALALVVPALGYLVVLHGDRPETPVLTGAAITLAFLLILRSFLSWLELAQHRVRAGVDPLTGLCDEVVLRERLVRHVSEAGQYRGEVALIVVDIDDFSRVNDLYGHDAGDGALAAVARVLEAGCSGGCSAYRAGGDEFAVVAPGRSAEEAEEIANRAARAIEATVAPGGSILTVSVGVASYSAAGDLEALVTDAFSALQSSKVRGRGLVTLHDERTESLPSPDERLQLARKTSYLATVRALAAAVDARDAASRDHSRTVAELSRRLGTEVGVAPDRLDALETAGMLHDIGKIALPDDMLSAREALCEDDRARLREHVELGERILRSTDLAFMLPWVRAHHERWDGSGYPDGLAGEDIPLESRIISVCNAYDAMTSGALRVPPLTHAEAMSEIEANAGTQFDSAVAEAFARMMARERGGGRGGGREGDCEGDREGDRERVPR